MAEGDDQPQAGTSRHDVVTGGDAVDRKKVGINTRLELKPSRLLDLKPRYYQSEMCDKVIKQNTIIYLGTGLGKTYIVVLFLRSPEVSRLIEGGKKVVFLTPTQDLTKQQAEYVHMHMPHRVKVYCGRTFCDEKHIDHWDRGIWSQELNKIDVLVMTPQIFASAVSTNILDFRSFAAIVFDECHHACGSKERKDSNHPYARIMRHFTSYYQTNTGEPRPRIVGLTASLINSMPKNSDCIRDGIEKLEKTMWSRCVTDIQVQEKKPLMVIHSHSDFMDGDSDIIFRTLMTHADEMKSTLSLSKVKRLREKEVSELNTEDIETLSFYNRLKLASKGISVKPGSFPKVLLSLANIRRKCGLWTLRTVCIDLIESLSKHLESPIIPGDIKPIYTKFVQFLSVIRDAMNRFLEGDAVSELLTYTQPKLLTLLKVLKGEYTRAQDASDERSEFSCVIFVHGRLEVVAINRWIQQVSRQVPEYNFIRCDYAIGLAASNTSKYACITKRKPAEQARMLDNFREGILNVIVTTSVLEEGIDLPVCSTVIRYDAATTFRVYVQSRGRARQEISSFITLCEYRNSSKTCDNLRKMNDFEERVKDFFKDKDIITEVQQATKAISFPSQMAKLLSDRHNICEEQLEEHFETADKLTFLQAPEARIRLMMYCNRLMYRCPFIDPIRYQRRRLPNRSYLTTLYMPPLCPIQEPIQGNPKVSEELADNSAIIAAFRALYEAKEFNPDGVPWKLTTESIDEVLTKANILPTYEPLDEEFSGKVVMKNTIEYVTFKSRLNSVENFLSRGYLSRTYKIIRLKFVAVEDQARSDTLSFFETAKFGLIVDSSMKKDFVCPELKSRYGKFLVQCDEVNNHFAIRERDDHERYLNFTHKLLAHFLSIGRIMKEDFKRRCLFYISLLDSDGKPNLQAMSETFHRPSSHRFKEGDVVKVAYYYEQNSEDRSKGRLLLVRKVQHDLGPDSQIPGMRHTFREAFGRRYGQGPLSPRQPVIEVMPIARDYAKAENKSTVRPDDSTQSIYFLSQVLELVSTDAAFTFQALNLLEIIFKLYLNSMANDLDSKFLLATGQYRDLSKQPLPAPTPEEREESSASEPEPTGETQAGYVADQPKGPQTRSRSHSLATTSTQSVVVGALRTDDSQDEYSDSSSDDNYSESDDDSVADSSVDDSGDEMTPTDQLKEIITKQYMNFKKDSRKRDLESFDFSQYQEKDLKEFSYKQERSFLLETEIRTSQRYVDLTNTIYLLGPLASDILADLMSMKSKLRAEIGLLDDDIEFHPRAAEIDRVEPPLRFDRGSKPMRDCSRHLAVAKALTHRRAQDSYNLEGLENIGDSYLKYIVSVILFKYLPEADEGVLTSARMRLVSNFNFTYLARKSGLGSYAITSSFDIPGLLQLLSGGRKDAEITMRTKDFADMFESLVGSYLVHCGEFDAILLCQWLGLDIFKDGLFQEFHRDAVVFSRCESALSRDLSGELLERYDLLSKRVRKFEEHLGYIFNDKSYLVQALTHPSELRKCVPSYERLEFLGDAILDFLVTISLFYSGSINDPGQLSTSKSQLVNNAAFAKLAIKYGFEQYLNHSNQELYEQLTKVKLTIEEEPEMSFLDINDFDQIAKLLGDIFESVAGAIYLDSGCSLDSVWRVYYPMLAESINQEIANPSKNPLSVLFETFPGQDRIEFGESPGPQTGTIIMRCTVKGFAQFEDSGIRKRQAKLRVVKKVLANLPSEEKLKQLNAQYLARHPAKPRQKSGGHRGSARGRGGGARHARGGRGGGRNHLPSGGPHRDRTWRDAGAPHSRSRSRTRY